MVCIIESSSTSKKSCYLYANTITIEQLKINEIIDFSIVKSCAYTFRKRPASLDKQKYEIITNHM